MSNLPTVNDVQAVEPILSNMLLAYSQSDDRFIASKIFPPVSVDKDSGTYYIFTKKYWFFDEMKSRAAGGQYARTGFGVESSTYSTHQFALAVPIADETRANSQVPMDLESAAVRFLAQKSLLRKEIAFSADWMLYTSWTSYDNNSATDWDDFTSGDPVNGVLTAKRTISGLTGVDANSMALGRVVHDAIVNHPDILDRIKYVVQVTQASVNSALAALFGVANYWVGNAVYSNTNESATFSSTSIIDDDCLIAYVAPNPGLFEASAGYTFNWAPGGGLGVVMKNRDELNDADVIKSKEQWDQKAIAADLGYFFADIV